MEDFPKIDQSSKISEKVTDVLLQYIGRNNLQPGEKLPSEKALASMLQVSSRAVRESIKSLEARGLVEIIQGKGTYLSTNTHEKFFSSLTLFHIINQKDTYWKIELLDFRILIETEAVIRLAQNPDEKRLRKLEIITKRMLRAKSSGSYRKYNEFDVQFHKYIADSLQNSIISSVYAELVNLIYATFEITVEVVFNDKGSIDPHVALLKEIKVGDTMQAKIIIQNHLNDTKSKLLTS